MRSFLQKANEDLQQLYAKSMNSLWMVLTTGSAEWLTQCEEDEKAYQEALASESLRDQLKQAKSQDKLSELEWRQIQVLSREMREYQTSQKTRERITTVWNECNYLFGTHRPVLDGEPLSEQNILLRLKQSNDVPARKRLWQASMEIGQHIAPKLIELVELRNQVARENGYENYYMMKLEAQDLSADTLQLQSSEVRKGLDTTYRQIKEEIDQELAQRFGIKREEIAPWHYTHPFFQEHDGFAAREEKDLVDIELLLHKLADRFQEMDLDISAILQNGHLTGKAGKSQANFCLHIDRAGDIRVSCNLGSSMRSLAILLHELGHAVYEQGIDRSLPFLLRQPAQLFMSEAVAALMERLAADSKWLGQLFGRLPEEADRYRQLHRRNLIVRLYWTITVMEFEKQLYANPRQSLNQLWWDLVEQIQGLSRPAEWDYPYWACKAHLTTLPVYYHHYLLGEIAAAQLEQSLSRSCGIWHSPEAMKLLQMKMFAPGSSKMWPDILKAVCGCTLHPHNLIEQLQQ